MLAFLNDNQNTYNLQSQKEPMKNGIPPALQPPPLDLRASKNLIPIRPHIEDNKLRIKGMYLQS